MTTQMPSDNRFDFSQRVRYMESFAEAVLDLPDEHDETISLAYGDADPAHFPVAALIDAMTHMMQSRVDETLNYAPPDADLLKLIHARMSRHNVNLPLSQYITVNGSSQIIGLLPQVLCDPGDVIIVEGPTFLGAVETFHNFGVRIEMIPVRADGMDLDMLEARLGQLRNDGVAVKCIYTIPTFQNPTGTLMPLANRMRLLAIAATYGVLIVEDDAYGDLHFNNALPPKLIALDTHDSVLYVGTFSKILAPGVRMAWACGPKALIQRLHRWKAEGSNGPFMTRLVAHVSRDGWLDRHIDHLNALYESKCAVLLRGYGHIFQAIFAMWCLKVDFLCMCISQRICRSPKSCQLHWHATCHFCQAPPVMPMVRGRMRCGCPLVISLLSELRLVLNGLVPHLLRCEQGNRSN